MHVFAHLSLSGRPRNIAHVATASAERRPGRGRRAWSKRLACAALTTVLLGGCMQPGRYDPARTGPFFTPTNHVGEPSLGGIRRVVVLPVWSGEAAPSETAADLDPVVLASLQDQHRFEIVTLSREDSRRRFRFEAFSSAAALPADFLATLRREFAADAVLFVDVTVYRAYRPLALGLRAKLATADGTRLIWTFDNVFSAEVAAVANSARNHFLEADNRVPADLTHGVLQSPSRFAAYASAAMFATLPPVIPAPAGPIVKR